MHRIDSVFTQVDALQRQRRFQNALDQIIILENQCSSAQEELISEIEFIRMQYRKGFALLGLRKISQAYIEFQRSEKLLKSLSQTQVIELGLDSARLKRGIGSVLRSKNYGAEALSVYAEAEELLYDLMSSNRIDVKIELAKVLRNSGAIFHELLNQSEDALRFYARAESLGTAIFEDSTFELLEILATVSYNKGICLQSKGQNKEALCALSEAERSFDSAQLRNAEWCDLYRAFIANHKANVLSKLGKAGAARKAFIDSQDLYKRSSLSGKEFYEYRAILSHNLAGFLAGQGERLDSFRSLEEAENLLNDPALSERRDLDAWRAKVAVRLGDAAVRLGHPEVAMSAWVDADRLYESAGRLSLRVQGDHAGLFLRMVEHIALMGPSAQSWAVSSSDRLVAMLDLAEPTGRMWDQMRAYFAAFHANWLGFCLAGDAADRAMVPRVLTAIQGRRLVAEVIEAALASGDAPGPIRDLAKHKQDMRDVLERLQRAEGGGTGGLLGGGGIDGDGTRGMESFVGLTSGLERRRDEAAIGALRDRFRAQEVELRRLKEVAAEVPGFEILGAPLGTMTTERLQAVLGPAEALVLAFPTVVKAGDAGAAGAVSAPGVFDTHLWVLRSAGAPTLVTLAAADARTGTIGKAVTRTKGTAAAAGTAAPEAWSRDLPGIVARVAGFSGSMSAGRGMRQGGWRVPTESEAAVIGTEAAAGTDPIRTTAQAADAALSEPAVARLDAAALRQFWPQLDAAMARLVWQPLRDSGALAGAEQILITTAGPLHNLPFEAGRHSAGLGTPDLWHASSLVDFALGRGLYGRTAPTPDAASTPADADGGSAKGSASSPDGAEVPRFPRVSLLTNSTSTDIPMAALESALAARIWTEAIGATGVIRDERYPWNPALAVDLAHAACHGSVDRDSPTPRAHLILAVLIFTQK